MSMCVCWGSVSQGVSLFVFGDAAVALYPPEGCGRGVSSEVVGGCTELAGGVCDSDPTVVFS